MFEQRQYEKAREALIKARKAPHREERPLADKGRQREITALLEQVDRKLDRRS